MDIEKLISDATDKSVNDVIDGKFKFFDDYPQLSEKSKEYAMLMNFSESLLCAYHQNLKDELAKQGINI